MSREVGSNFARLVALLRYCARAFGFVAPMEFRLRAALGPGDFRRTLVADYGATSQKTAADVLRSRGVSSPLR